MVELQDFITRLAGEDEAERIYAAEDIGYANCLEGVAPLFLRLPLEPSRAVREAIFGALQSIEDDSVTEGALRLLESDDTFVRNQAVELLRRRGSNVIPFLNQAFRSAEKDPRKMMVDVLAAIDGPGSEELYGLALADCDVNVVITAVESLGNARKTQFRERIEDLVTAGDPMLAGACLETLAQIGNAHSLALIQVRASAGCTVPDYLLPPYLKMLGAQGDESAIAEAAGLLDSRGAHLQAAILNAITLLRQRYPLAPLPETLVEPLKSVIQIGNSLLRRQALRLLGEFSRLEAVAAFLAGCQETNQDSTVDREDFGV
jgi:hypothetical protein